MAVSTCCPAAEIKVSKIEDLMFTELCLGCFYLPACFPALFLLAGVPAFPVCKKQQEALLLPQRNLPDRLQVLPTPSLSLSLIGQWSSNCALIGGALQQFQLLLINFNL